jgi:uncharacterized PurR-regulated membrane protein YhhQ (DUF165 family)
LLQITTAFESQLIGNDMKIVITAYLLSMTAANLLVSQFGPSISPIIAFFLIGMDLTLRDWLHVRLRAVQMFGLIGVAGVLTFALNPAAGVIAIASSAAFTTAALVDWAVFSKITGSWIKRSNTSNLAGAAVDSLVFPTIAFGALMPQIVLMQFVAKVAGGAVWAYAIDRLLEKKLGRQA